jgi:hypothetical protein
MRTHVAKRPDACAAGLVMAFKLIGVFEKGEPGERPVDSSTAC